jgi:peptidoglycan/xylan/chitin deacetylase (PgdA/CDA1 family)
MPPIPTNNHRAPGNFWDLLEEELGAWHREGRIASFWWRDDDAAAPTPALDRLLGLSAGAKASLGLAVVPKWLTPELAPRLKDQDGVVVLQHGYAHVNHAQGRGASEIGLDRPIAEVLDELRAGREILERAFGPRFLPVIAAPWNRVARELLPSLRQAGFIGVSAFGERPYPPVLATFVEANIHFDLLAWKGGARFRGEAAAAGEILGHLRRRRTGQVDPIEPTGILSHHLKLDEPAWDYFADLLACVARHPAAIWLRPEDVFRPR